LPRTLRQPWPKGLFAVRNASRLHHYLRLRAGVRFASFGIGKWPKLSSASWLALSLTAAFLGTSLQAQVTGVAIGPVDRSAQGSQRPAKLLNRRVACPELELCGVPSGRHCKPKHVLLPGSRLVWAKRACASRHNILRALPNRPVRREARHAYARPAAHALEPKGKGGDGPMLWSIFSLRATPLISAATLGPSQSLFRRAARYIIKLGV